MPAYRNGYYRVYFKEVGTYAGYKIYGSARVLSFDLTNDLISSACSTINVDKLPNSVIAGDLAFVVDPSGELFYKGVIETIEGNQITLGDILKMFEDEIVIPTSDYSIKCKLHDYPKKIFEMAQSQTASKSVDMKEYMTYANYDFEVINNKNLNIQRTFEPFSTLNVYEELKSLYKKRNLIVDADISLTAIAGNDKITSTYAGDQFIYKIIDNSVYTVNFAVEEEVTDINKLLIWKKMDDTNYTLVKKLFLTPNGLTDNMDDLTRLRKIKTKNVFLEKDATNEDVQKAIDENIEKTLYLHQIEIELLANNPLYDWRKMKLGEKYQVYVENKYYQTILTGIEFKKESTSSEMQVFLTFGKSRTKLTDLVLT